MPKVKFEESEVLWKDRKRILGMPISFTRYIVNADRLITHKGLIRTTTDELLLYRILDIKLVRSLGQKIFGVGTITLYTADQSDATFHIRNVKKSEEVRTFLSKMVEQERQNRGLIGREIYGAAGMMSDAPDLDGDGFPG